MCLSRHKTIGDLRDLANVLEQVTSDPHWEELIEIVRLVKRCFLHLVHVTDTDESVYQLSLADEFIDWTALSHSLMYDDVPEEEVDDALYNPKNGEHFATEPKPERPPRG